MYAKIEIEFKNSSGEDLTFGRSVRFADYENIKVFSEDGVFTLSLLENVLDFWGSGLSKLTKNSQNREKLLSHLSLKNT